MAIEQKIFLNNYFKREEVSDYELPDLTNSDAGLAKNFGQKVLENNTFRNFYGSVKKAETNPMWLGRVLRSQE